MKRFIPLHLACALLALARPTPGVGQTNGTEIVASTLVKLISIVEPGSTTPAWAFSTRLEVTRAEGLPKGWQGQQVEFAFQAPDRLRVAGKIEGRDLAFGRDGQRLWAYAPGKKFGVVGEAGQPLFLAKPEKLDSTQLPPFSLPLPMQQLLLIPLLMNLEVLPPETVDQMGCHVLRATAKPEASQSLKLRLPPGAFTLWIRTNDHLIARVGYREGDKTHVEVALRALKHAPAGDDAQWRIPARAGDAIQKTAVTHLARFVPVAFEMLTQHLPSLGPAKGERKVVATEGRGRLELVDGTRVLYLAGTPQEMGRQQGVLLKKEIRHMVNRILYGVGVASSFEKGRWFFGEIEEAQRRIAPFIDARYLAEMDAIAEAVRLDSQEVRLANFFPELFHCSGFALFGKATVDGALYHGRILDYLKGVGLEQNAVVVVYKPDQGNAWVNVSYAGFVGSVTAMNAQRVAIGEMGGRGEGKWDGKPMAQLVREVMERANTLDEAVEIMRRGPRTCEYYYVVSDAKSHTAVGIAATPDKFEIVRPGQAHERLPEAIADAVLMSAGDRYQKLVERVKSGYGKLDAAGARDLMRRPVAMTSNIHSVLFAPDTLDFWVANADSKDVASHTRYTHYNLAEMLKE